MLIELDFSFFLSLSHESTLIMMIIRITTLVLIGLSFSLWCSRAAAIKFMKQAVTNAAYVIILFLILNSRLMQ